MTERTLPGKSAEAYRTISEVAEELKLPQHVLRFWETRFPQVKPLKRAGGRRFYRPEDVALLRAIKLLLYGEGYTIKGVQRLLQERGARAVAVLAAPGATAPEDRQESGMNQDDRPGADVRRNVDERPPMVPLAPAPALPPGPAPRVRQAPDTDPVAAMVARLEAVAFDLSECGRLLAAARAVHD